MLVEIGEALKKQDIYFTFAVQELSEEKIVADPFLVLRVADHHIYIDVWDEPSFEGRKTV